MMAPGFTQIDDNAILRSGEIGPSAFQVYAAIAQHCREQRQAWPGVQRLAQITGLSSRSVRYAVSRLETSGWIVVDRSRGRQNTYNLPPIESKAISCPTPKTSKATDCRGVRQPVAAGKAINDTKVRQPVAPEAYHRSKPISKPKKQTKARGCAAAGVEIPKELDSEIFRDAWVRWTAHRKELRKPLTPTTVDAQLRKLVTLGQTQAIAAINRSIEAGWTGIFEPSKNGNGKPSNNFADGPGQRFDPNYKSTVPVVGGF